LSPQSQQFYTSIARQHVAEVRQNVTDLDADARRAVRLATGECPCCFYLRSGRVGGAAMTTWFCGVCGKQDMHGSTATPKLCRECSTTHELCRECGGDLAMRSRRKKPWAEPVP
jgi:hypothetical protein